MIRKKTQLASRLDRWLASTIDGLGLLVILPVILVAPLINNYTIIVFLVFLALSIFLLVQAYFLSTAGQSIGKILMRIKIVEIGTGRNGGFVPNVLLRFLVGVVLLGTIPFYPVIDTLFIFREDKRCIHDLIAGTCVVDT